MSLRSPEARKNEKIQIAILDTGFCPEKIYADTSKIKIHEVENMTGTFKTPCRQKTLLGRRFHGHHVLQQFITELNRAKLTNDIEIHPMIIFDQKGVQKIDYWDKAFKRMDHLQTKFALIAAGFPLSKDIQLPNLRPQIIHFLASGKVGVGITPETRLFPQLLHEKENIFLIGSYYPPAKNDNRIILDSSMLYRNETDYYFSGGNDSSELRGTSLAVATALAKAINLCLNEIDQFRECLAKNKKSLSAHFHDQILNINTF